MKLLRRGIRFLSLYTASSKIIWDPTKALELNDPLLILLERSHSRHHFKQILGKMMKKPDLIGQTFPMSRLILFSAISHPENIDLAILLFNHFTPFPNLYIFNTMILGSSCSKNQSFSVYNSMLHSGLYPDKQTLIYLLQASKCVIQVVEQIHCHAIVFGLSSFNLYLQNSLLKKYLENEQMEVARKLFDEMSNRDSVSYNIMIVGYAKRGNILEGFELFLDMMDSGTEPDEFTMLGLLLSCGQSSDLKIGKSVHAWIERNKEISLNLILGNALLDMYVKCKELKHANRIFGSLIEKDTISWNTMIAGYAKVGELDLAHDFFDRTPRKDVVSWNSLISGYAQSGGYVMVERLFSHMLVKNVKPDNVTMINLMSAITEIGALDKGRWIHGLVVKMKMQIDAFLGSVLIDMYYKCGSIERAYIVFEQVKKRDITVWTTMITGFAFHGFGKKALELFSSMQKETTPNGVTLISVLTACSHCGLVDKGLEIFNNMKKIYGIDPGIEHYGCIVDLLGRFGRLSDAIDVIEKMPMKPSRSTWGAILSACRAHGNVEIAERALMELVDLEPKKEGGYILMSNLYASCGKWSSSDKVREMMESRGVKKIAGCSSVVIDGVVYDFVVADKRNPRWEEIRRMLSFLGREMSLEEDFLLTFVVF